MGRIVVTAFISLDGVAEDPGGVEGFRRGGWALDISRGEEGDRFKLDETMASDAQLLGRATYEVFAASWPSREGELADKFNAMPKYVYSSTLKDVAWNNSTVIGGDLGEAVAVTRERHAGDIVVHGSVRLARGLLERGLVDALHLMVYPVLLGEGRRLFGETSERARLRLTESRTVGDGVQILTYARV